MKLIILILLPLISLAQPDTSKVYLTVTKPLKAIRFYVDGTFVAHSYQKPYKPKDVRIPIEKIDSGTYIIKRFGIVMKGKVPKFMRYDDKKKDLYEGIFKSKRIKKYEANLFPTMKEWERLEWIRKNNELYIKQSQEYIKNKAIASIKKWCPEYMIVVDSAYCGPGCYNSVVNGKTIPYGGDTSVSFPHKLNTLLHETTHRYNKIDWGWDKDLRHRYMITPGHDLWARHTKLYSSCEFIAIVPKDAPSKIFRYGTYVGTNSEVSANSWGIYGMMDEFSAYYNGTRSNWIGYQTAKAKGDKVSLKIFEEGCLSTYFAWYEFRTFTGWYLLYAKQKYPEIYKETMGNPEIVKVFTELDREFGDLVTKIEKEFKESWLIEQYEKDYVSYLRPIMKGLEPTLTEFKSLPPIPTKKKTNKKQ